MGATLTRTAPTVSSPANASAPVAVSFLPEQLNVTLQLPAPQAHFRFALRACTRAGPGEPVVRLGSTAPEPGKPHFLQSKPHP